MSNEAMTLEDRVEFALRDAGFGLDEASRIATLAAEHKSRAQPASVQRAIGVLTAEVERGAEGLDPTINPNAIRAAIRMLQAQPAVTVTDEMVQRFLGWRLPDTFAPDCYVSFDREGIKEMGNGSHWPSGTNLLNDPEARAMLEHVLAVAPPPAQPANFPTEMGMSDRFDDDDRVAPESIGYARGWNACRKAVLAAQPASVDGWVMVPREPTDAMVMGYLTANKKLALSSVQAWGVSDPRQNFKAGYLAMLAAAPQPTPNGFALVPIEPTQTMLDAGMKTGNLDGRNRLSASWQMMIYAAPQPPNGDEHGN